MTEKNTVAAKILDIVSGKLDQAELALAAIRQEIHATAAVIAALKARLAEAPPLSVDASYAAFAETRRRAIRRQLAAMAASFESLRTEENARRLEVERLLRQKLALEGEAAARAKVRARTKA